SGDVATLIGDVRLDDGAKIAGDVAAIGGNVRRSPQATIAGDVSSMGGAGWVILAFAVPLLVVAGLIALGVWLIRRADRPQPVPPRDAVSPHPLCQGGRRPSTAISGREECPVC